MSTATPIEWTRGDDGTAGKTWNPVTGCTEVSEGCDNCYAKTFSERWRGVPGHPFEQGFDVRLWPERLGQPLKWRKSKRVFVNSMSDLFIGPDHVPDPFLAAVWATMYWTSSEVRGGWSRRPQTPVHTYQILTKRPARMRAWLQRWADRDQRTAMLAEAAERGWADEEDLRSAAWMPTALPNVWLGVSVESERWARVRLPQLVEVPAVVRFVSCEPLLGELDLRPWLGEALGWVIAGGESGAKARPMHPDWARGLRNQCVATGVPFFFKQWGQFSPYRPTVPDPARPDGRAPDWDRAPSAWVERRAGAVVKSEDEVPDTGSWQAMFRVGKGRAGRDLDGRTWDEFPGRRVAGAGHG